MTHPLVAVLRRYVVDYTNGHDTGVVPSIMDRSYRFTMSGTTVDYDGYVAMVDGAFDDFPDLELVVHELFTDGHRLAMRFSEHGSSTRHGGRRSVWQGISMYRWNGFDRLTECRVEQDFHGRRAQLAAGVSDSLEPPMTEPWSVEPQPADPRTERATRAWATVTLSTPLLEITSRSIDDVVIAGTRAAVRTRLGGRYLGGLFGVPDDRIGTEAWIDVMATVRVRDGVVSEDHTVSDRFGLRERLTRG